MVVLILDVVEVCVAGALESVRVVTEVEEEGEGKRRMLELRWLFWYWM